MTGVAQSLAALVDLARRARLAASASELGFLLVNDSRALVPYRQAALWLKSEGVQTLSGLVQVDANAPYALWLEQICSHLAQRPSAQLLAFTASDLPLELAEHWAEWWPAHALWVGFLGGGLLLVRDTPWTEPEQDMVREWVDTWWHAYGAVPEPQRRTLRGNVRRLHAYFGGRTERPWWRRPTLMWSGLVLLTMACPVRLTVMAPGELVPAHPVVVRAPLDGVLDVFHVQPNQLVKKGQALFGFDEALIQSRLEVAAQTLSTAETEYRQTSQQALMDAKSRPQLAMLTGKIEEKRAELDFLTDQLARSRVLAPQDGVALFDDPSEWIGRPVVVGERIMRIAKPTDIEVEAWLPMADAIPLQPNAPVSLYLNASPLQAVDARLRYMAHDAVQRPDGSFAYRVRATLEGATEHRVGLKGTAKLQGDWVALGYWVLRRPLATLRSFVGW